MICIKRCAIHWGKEKSFTMKQIRFLVDLNGEMKSFMWMSLQDDGSVSVGISDRTFIAPKFESRSFIWNLYNRRTIHYLVPHTPKALEPVERPHFTFHPPMWFHLRAQRQPALFEGIALVDAALDQQHRYEWLRIASKPIALLATYRGERNSSGATEVIRIPAPAPRSSIGIGIDFVKTTSEYREDHRLLDTFEIWDGRNLHIFSESLPIQDVTTMAWFHHS